MTYSLKVLAAAAVMGLGSMSAGNAALIDFTDNAVVAGISGNSLSGSNWTLTGSPSTLNLVNGGQGPGPIGPLKGDTDGIGIADDEISYPRESLTLTFDWAVKMTGIYVLDLFFGAVGTEFVVLSVDGVPVGSGGGTQFNPGAGNTNPGYTEFTGLSFIGKVFTFTVGATNDIASGVPDYALAGVDVAPVPLPAGALLLGTALAGFGLMRRNRRAA